MASLRTSSTDEISHLPLQAQATKTKTLSSSTPQSPTYTSMHIFAHHFPSLFPEPKVFRTGLYIRRTEMPDTHDNTLSRHYYRRPLSLSLSRPDAPTETCSQRGSQ